MDDLAIVQQSFHRVLEDFPNFAELFYARFFKAHPELRELFTGAEATQQQMLNETLIAVVDHLNDESWVESSMQALGIRHQGYEVEPQMYDWWADCLIETLRDLAGDAWSETAERVWREQVTHICALARDARVEAL